MYFRWFHGKLKREEAEALLNPRHPGLFLVRESNNFPGDYTLCVVNDQLQIEHYHISYENNKLTLDKEAFFENLIPLVEVCILTAEWVWTGFAQNIFQSRGQFWWGGIFFFFNQIAVFLY